MNHFIAIPPFSLFIKSHAKQGEPVVGGIKDMASAVFGAKPTVTQTGVVTVDGFGYLF